jgi:transposase
MRDVIRANYEEVYLFPPSVEEWIEKDHPARFIREFVDQLEDKEYGFDGPRSEEGGSYYDPRLLLRVILYGYLKKVRSFRGMERGCFEDIGFIWLSGNRRPDHNSLWRFFDQHKGVIGKVFKQTVKVAMKMELVGLTLQALDGTKIQARCSGRNLYDERFLKKLERALDQSIREQEQGLEASHASSQEERMKLPDALKDREVLREKVRAALKVVNEQGIKHCHPEDPEARRMESDGRNRFSYNAQAVVDEKSQVIVAQEVNNQANDIGLMTPMMEKAVEQTQVKVQTLTDGGYASSEDFAKAKQAGFSVVSPLPNGWRNVHDFHSSKFKHDPTKDVVICPQGKELKFRGTRSHRGRLLRVYRDQSVCKNCPVQTQCTADGRHGRMIEIGPHHQALVEHRDMLEDENVLKTLKKRAGIVEPVFAQIKANSGFRRWTVQGLDKVNAQWSLLCIAWNLSIILRYRREKPDREPEKPRIHSNPSPTFLKKLLNLIFGDQNFALHAY